MRRKDTYSFINKIAIKHQVLIDCFFVSFVRYLSDCSSYNVCI